MSAKKPPQRDVWRSLLPTQQPGDDPQYPTRSLQLEIVHANPDQSRQAFNEESHQELAASVREHGVIQPIIVRPHPRLPGEYLIVAGERRRRAAEAAELTEIPAIVRDDLDATGAAILTALENLQRQNLDVEDEGRYFVTLLKLTGLSQRALAEKLGINHVYISRRVKLLEDPTALRAYQQGEISLLDAAAVAEDPETVSDRNRLPNVVERAALPEPRTIQPAGPVVLPYKTERPINNFALWLARTDPRTVPKPIVPNVREYIRQVRQQLDQWEEELEQTE